MKNLKFLVMTEEISTDYSKIIIKGINKFCNENDIDCVICNIRHPKYSLGVFEYQFWAASELINTQCIDVVIVLSGIYCSSYTPEELAKILSAFKGKTIVSISQELPIENSYSILTDNENIYTEIFDFLVNKCGSKRIAFMSANKTNSAESMARFNAYKKQLARFNMEYDDSIAFHACFTMSSAIDELKERNLKKPDFDTFIAANDQMALGAMQYFKEHDIKVPEDVKVFGFDDIEQASTLKPSLSTVNPGTINLGYYAAKVAFSHINGQNPDKNTIVPAGIVIRESTGYENCEKMERKIKKEESLDNLVTNTFDNMNLYYLLDSIQTNDTLDSLFKRLPYIFKIVNIKKFALCLFESPVTYKKGTVFDLPKKVQLAFTLENDESKIHKDYYFRPMDNLLPEEVFEKSSDLYIMQSLFYGEKHYGYFLYSPGDRELPFYNLYTKIVSNTLVNSYEYTKQYENNIDLKMQNLQLENTARTDEMTGVLNRRGFIMQAQHQIDYAIETGSTGVVIYGDMNHLKYINDKFGHEAGDNAIKTEAAILKKTFRSTDSIGRMGGDEFAIVATGLTLEKMDIIREKLKKNCDEANQKNTFPFEISISLGAVPFNSEKHNLEELLPLADENQYTEKRRFHEAEKAAGKIIIDSRMTL